MVRSHFPDAGTMSAVLAMATRAPSVHNSQPWHWQVDSKSLHLYANPSRQLPRTDPDRRDLMLSCGAALHHCTVALAATGWRAVVNRLPDPADPDYLAELTVEPQSAGELDVMLASAIGRRQTDRRNYSPGPVPWGDIALMGARAARSGVMLRQIELIPQLSAIVADSVARYPADPVPAPRFAGPALNRSPGSPADEDNGVVVALGTESDDSLARLRAGEATSLVLLSATAMGLASCPVTEPLEIPETRAAVRADVFGFSGHPQMLLRLGWAPAGAEPIPATPRRPVREVADWLPDGAFAV